MKTAASQMIQRAPFQSDLLSLREMLPSLLPILEVQPDWYASVYFERKASKNWTVNLKQSNVSDQVSQGVVLRIYDGYTLFEQATDDLDPESLKKLALNFSKRVANTRPDPKCVKRLYKAPSWTERLSVELDDEIRSQVPTGVSAKIPVHFGIRFKLDPKSWTTEKHLQHLKTLVNRCVELSPSMGMLPEELTYVMGRQSFWEEESLFIDRETNMSQTLYRQALSVVTMSGADRTYNRLGGLGGMEAVEFTDKEIRNLLQDLKALKSAEKLSPGKYRLLMGPVLTGVLAHEAFGHAQEGDTCARGRSKAWDLHQSGQLVGNSQATILNNPAIFKNGADDYAAWGSYFFDEEGWLAQEQVLLDAGKLMAPMTNLTSAIRLGVPRSANGKRESWATGVYTRQTNTYFSAGQETLDQLMSKIDDGFLAMHPAGGMEDPKGMGIQVGISFLKEVKNGKVTGRVFKGPAGGDIQLTGYVPEVLNSIIGKSKVECDTSAPDQARHPYNDAGGCGKYHKEFVFAGCGGPYVLLDQVILG